MRNGRENVMGGREGVRDGKEGVSDGMRRCEGWYEKM